jgi:hypothetical protein
MKTLTSTPTSSSSPSPMKACRVHRFGLPDVITLEDMERPESGSLAELDTSGTAPASAAALGSPHGQSRQTRVHPGAAADGGLSPGEAHRYPADRVVEGRPARGRSRGCPRPNEQDRDGSTISGSAAVHPSPRLPSVRPRANGTSASSLPSPSCRPASSRRSSMAPRLRTLRSPALPRPCPIRGPSRKRGLDSHCPAINAGVIGHADTIA